MQLLQHPPQAEACLLEAGAVGSQTEAEALHRLARTAVAAGQGPAQAKTAATPLQPQRHAAGRQQGVVLPDGWIPGVWLCCG